jgi:hypothetical protein
MTYPVRRLINEAYYLSSIVSREFQSVSGSETTGGLEYFNDLLAVEGITGETIQYYSQYDFNAVTGQEKYFIPNLIEAETLTFKIQSIRYSVRKITRDNYFGRARADDITSLPHQWHTERTKGGTDLYIYFSPDVNYPMQIWGKFGLEEIDDLDLDLKTIYDNPYITYLKYALARYICENFDQPVPVGVEFKLTRMEGKMRNVSPPDLSIEKLSGLRGYSAIDYPQINLGGGWRP